MMMRRLTALFILMPAFHFTAFCAFSEEAQTVCFSGNPATGVAAPPIAAAIIAMLIAITASVLSVIKKNKK